MNRPLLTGMALLLCTAATLGGGLRARVAEAYTAQAPSPRQWHIPRRIWTYWHERELPAVVKECIISWARYNPGYTITVLNPSHVKALCNVDLDALPILRTPYRYSDFARLLVLAKFGGIWIDATVICTQPLSWVNHYAGSDLIGYVAPDSGDKHPIPENWFFAAPPASPFVVAWLQEAFEMLKYPSEQAYIDAVREDTDMGNLPKLLPYLVMHLCATRTDQKGVGRYRLTLLDPLAEGGPFLYLSKNGWDAPRALASLCTDPAARTPLIKLRGSERGHVMRNRIQCDGLQDQDPVRRVLGSSSSEEK